MADLGKVLVTGAGGFIGHHLVTYLKRQGYWVRGADLHYPQFSPIDANEFVLLDLRRWENCFCVTRGGASMKLTSAPVDGATVTLSERAESAAPKVRLSAVGCLLLLCSLAFLGCTSPPHTFAPDTQSTDPAPQVAGGEAPFTAQSQNASDLERLTQLWHKRTDDGPLADYPLGPGDVLGISVPAMEELKDRVVRVSGEGTIALPLIGVVKAAGLPEEELREAIRRQLEGYMYNPQVDLFVREYRSRQVAVLGAVAKPGVYSLASETDTVLDMVALAGGMAEESAQRLLLIPADPADNETAKKLAAVLPAQFVSKDPSPLILKQTDPLVIDLNNLVYGGHQLYLSLPARPGDVIMVPGGGQVLVQGWVEKPGAYKIMPGLTVLGAVAAAGGALFAADTAAVNVIRTGKRGEKLSYLADLEQIKAAKQPDIPVQEGDVIDVASSAPKLVPYGLYRIFTSVLHVGAGASVPVR
jgi:polysaccharide export outer membrane protein